MRCPGSLGSCSLVCPLGELCCVRGVLSHLAPVHRCARSVSCVGCAVSWATWLLFSGVFAQCAVLAVRCPGPLGSCLPVRALGVSFCVYGVLGPLAPVHQCARSVCCDGCGVFPWPLGSCSPVCPPGVFCCVCGVLGHLAPVHRFARRYAVLGVPCPGPLDSCSPVCPVRVLCCVSGVLGPLAPCHRCPRSVCCVGCAVSWATWLLFTGVPARCVVFGVRCPGPLGSCSPVCSLGVLCCVCRVLGYLAPIHRCARSVCCVACAVSWAPWLLFTSVPAWCVALLLRCPGQLGSCSPLCPFGVLCWVCGVLGYLAPVHRCARSVCCVACAVSWAPWLLFTGVPAWCVALLVRCPGQLGSCSPVCPFGVLCWVCGVLGHLATGRRCARSVCRVACTVSWAPWLLFSGVPARCAVLGVRCPGPLGSCSTVCPLRVFCCVRGVLGPLAPVHRCARSVCGVGCAVSWATWLLFTGVPARCAVLRVRCPGPLGSCSPVCPPGVLCCMCGVLAPSLLFTGVLARCVVPWIACAGVRFGAHTRPSGQRLFVAGRGGVPSGRALVHQDGGCFVACRGWVPSGRALVHPDGGCSLARRGWVRCRARTRPSGRRLVLLGTCSGALVRCVLCPLSGFAAPGSRCCLAPVRGPWLWLAACLSGVPRGPAWCAAPRPVRSLSVLRWAFPAPCCLSPARGLAPLALLGGCAGHAEAGRGPGSLCLPLAHAEAGALGSLRVVPVRGPAMGLSLAGPFGVGLGLRALRWLAWVDPVTDGSDFPYRSSLDGGLAGAPRLFRVDPDTSSCGSEGITPGSRSCVRVLVRPGQVGRAGLRGAFWCASPFPLAALSFCFARPPPGWGCPFFGSSVALPPPHFFYFLPSTSFSSRPPCLFLSLVSGPGCLGPWRFVFPSFFPPGLCFFFPFFFSRCSPRLSLAFSGFQPRVPSASALCAVCFVGLPLLGSLCALASFVLLASPLAASWWLLPPPLPFVSRGFRRCRWVLRFFSSLVVRPHCLWLSLVSGPGCPGPWRCVLFVLLPSRFSAASALSPLLCFPPGRWLLPGGCSPPPPFLCLAVFGAAAWCSVFFCLFRCAPLLSLAFSGFRPRVPWALALCAVCFVGLPLLGCLCALASFVFPAWPLAAPWWLQPPPPLLCLVVFVAPARCSVFFFFFSSLVVQRRRSWLSLVSVPGCPGPWRCVLFILLASRFSALRALSPLLCFPPGRWLLPGGCCPPPRPLCLRGALCFLVLPPCAALPCCVPCCGTLPCCVVGCCALCGVCWGVCLCVLLCCRLLLRVVPCLWWCLPVGLFAVWLAVWILLCFAVCRAVLCVRGCGAAPRCCASCRPVLCCCVLCCFVALVWSRCWLSRAL